MAYIVKPRRQERDAVDFDALHNCEGAITDKMLNIEGRQTNILPLPVHTTVSFGEVGSPKDLSGAASHQSK